MGARVPLQGKFGVERFVTVWTFVTSWIPVDCPHMFTLNIASLERSPTDLTQILARVAVSGQMFRQMSLKVSENVSFD